MGSFKFDYFYQNEYDWKIFISYFLFSFLSWKSVFVFYCFQDIFCIKKRDIIKFAVCSRTRSHVAKSKAVQYSQNHLYKL